MKPFPRCRAFTLIEMLVVITVIVIIVGLLFPVSMRALDKARTAKCAANMASIYRAYQMRKADENKNPRWVALRSSGWAGVLLAYVDGKGKIFQCPRDRVGHWGGLSAMMHLGKFGSGGGRVTPGQHGTSQFDSGRNFNYASRRYWSPGGPDDWPGGVTGLSPERYQSVSTYRGALGATSGWSVVFWTARADQYDWGFGSGNEAAIFTVLPAQRRLRVVSVSIGSPLLDGKGAPNAQTGFTNLSSLPANTLIDVDMVTRCSYGMNDHDVEGGILTSGSDWLHETYSFFWPKVPANKILLMDYTNAQVAAHTMASNSVTWGTNTVAFRRHSASTRANVLFGDGTVQLMDPAAVDPGVPGNYATYWEPERP